jgi:hypothetical protein
MRKFIVALAIAMTIPTTIVNAEQPWTDSQRKSFQSELYTAAESEGNWKSSTSDPELLLMTECITEYYADSVPYAKAEEYLDSMPPSISAEFDTVLEQCYRFVQSNRIEAI